MAERTEQLLRATRDEGQHHAGSSTLHARAAVRPDADQRDTTMFGEMPQAITFQMELVARASASAETALPAIIDLLVDGSPAKRAAIVTAITDNDPLREQWQSTWAALRH